MKLLILSAAACLLALGSLRAQTNVPGTSNPWLAPSGSTDPSGDSTPVESPRLANGLGLFAGETLTFSVSGSVAFDGSTPVDPPDGEDNYPVLHGAENGLSGVNAPANGLVAVFIDPSVPADATNASAPAPLDFFDETSVPGGRNYTTLAPKLNQVFFIGDGLTAGGAAQQITVPDGAGALYFGSMDGSGWYNNSGAFTVATTAVTGTTVPLTPTTFLVNGSNSPSNYFPGAAVVIPSGTPLKFTATQGSTAAGLYVRVQASATPTDEGSWTDIADTTNGGAGFLHADGNGGYSLSTTQVPNGSAEYFRAISAAPGYADSISDFYIGPFDLSGSTAVSTAQLRINQKAGVNDTEGYTVAQIGDKITYTFALTNEGTGTATGVTVVDHLPSHLRFVSADNSFTTTDVSTDGVSGGGTVTWKIGDLPPNSNSPIVLKLVTTVTNDAPINSVIANTSFTANGNGLTPVAGSGEPYLTTVKAPLDVEITSNGTSISPGGTLVYSFAVGNSSLATIKGVALDLPIGTGQKVSTAIFVDQSAQPLPPAAAGAATFADVSGRPTVGTPTATINSGDVLLTIGSLKKGAKAYFQVTVPIPYDADPKAPISLADAKITTTKAVGGLSQYTLEIAPAKLSGNPPVNPPHFTLFKFIPDGLSILQLTAENAEAKAYFDGAFPGLDSVSGIQSIGTLINPDILDTTADDGTYQQSVLAPGQPNGPTATHITYALIFANSGGFSAQNVVLTDRIPTGTKFDKTTTYQPTYNGVPFAAGQVTLDSDGSTIHFNLGTVKADKLNADGSLKKPSLGLVLYTVDVLKASKGGTSLGASIQAQGGTLATTSLIHVTEAQPNEIDTVVTAPGAAYIESYKGTAQAVLGGEIPYDIYYRNTGGLIPTDFRIVDALPVGTSFVSATFLDKNHVPRAAKANKGESIDQPAAGATTGSVTFHLGGLKQTGDGFVRMVVKVENSALNAPGLVINNDPMVPADVFPSNPQRKADGPEARAAGASPLVLTNSRNSSILVTPEQAVLQAAAAQAAIPHLDIGLMVPTSVKEGSTYDCLVFAANTTGTVIHAEVIVPVPAGAEFVSAGTGVFQGVYLAPVDGTQPYVLFEPIKHDDSDNLIENDVEPHSALLYQVTLRAPSGSAGKSLIASAHTAQATYAPNANGVSVAPVYSTNASTYVYGASVPFADVASQIVTAGLDANGSSAATLGAADLQKQIAALTPSALSFALGGTDALALSNNTVVIPIGAVSGGMGNAIVLGPTANIAASGSASKIISQDGGSIVAQGGGNLLSVLNLGGGIVAQGGGNLQLLLAGIVAQGGGNIVAQGGGNIVAQGGGNIISQDGSGVISNDGGSLIRLDLAGIVAQGGGNIVAAGGGNIVAQGGGNIVAQGGGNIVAQGGGNIVAQGGGNVIVAGGGVINTNGSNLMSPRCDRGYQRGGRGNCRGGRREHRRPGWWEYCRARRRELIRLKCC